MRQWSSQRHFGAKIFSTTELRGKAGKIRIGASQLLEGSNWRLAKQCPHCNMDWHDPKKPKRLGALESTPNTDSQSPMPLPGFTLRTAEDKHGRKLLSDIENFGWHVVHVNEGAKGPGFSFSVGSTTAFSSLKFWSWVCDRKLHTNF